MAAPVRIEVQVLRNDFPAIPGRMRRAASNRIHAAGFRVQAHAQGIAPVDTGAHRAAILNTPAGDLVTIIRAGMHYAIYLEFGTRKMAPRPALRPAMEAEPPRLIASFQGIEGELAA